MKKYYDNEYFVDDKVVKEYNDNYDFNLALSKLGEDIDKAKENITRFMLGRMKHNLKYMLNNYGLKEEEIVDKKVLVRAINRDF
ncbi:MAG: hypothetical protein IJ572_03495 [Bacilli bacterium]|nr:hypothetical protein [Bacilli bacterium]